MVQRSEAIERPSRRGNGALLWLAALATVALLVVARELLIPLAVAVMVWILIQAIADGIGGLSPALARIPRWVRMALGFALIGAGGWLLVELVARNVGRVQAQLPVYQANLDARLGEIATRFGMADAAAVSDMLREVPVMAYVGQLAGALASLAGTSVMVLIYLLFLLVEQRHFPAKFDALCRHFGVDDMGPKRDAIKGARHAIERYVGIKFAASALTGAASWLVLRFLDVDLAAFWGVVIFLLNFIPTIGSIFAVALPLTLILVQFPEPLSKFLVALFALGAIQFLVGNVLEPRWTSGSLGLSPLALILSLSAWGLMWGIVGMFLSVPLTVVLAIVCAQFDRTKPVALLLSEKGSLTPPESAALRP